MAAFDYAGLRDSVVIPLIRDFGKDGTLLSPGVATGPDYDPQPGDDVPQAVKLVETDFTQEDKAGGTVQADDLLFIASPDGVTIDPALPDRLSVAGVIYQVIKIKPLSPGPVTMLWFVHVRK